MSDDANKTVTALDDERRVKVLSPGQLVAKRFFRNKLAMAGLIILIVMFIFSFIGGMVSPYQESQVFRKTEAAWKDYAGAAYNDSYQFRAADGVTFPVSAQQKFILAVNKGEESFEADGVTYMLELRGEEYYTVLAQTPVATVLTLKGKSTFKKMDGATLSDAAKKAFETAVKAEKDSFEADGTTYFITKSGREQTISCGGEVAIASKVAFNAPTAENELTYSFEAAALTALADGKASFTEDGKTYDLNLLESGAAEISENGTLVATVSRLIVSPQVSGTFLPLEFKEAVEQAIEEKADSFTVEDSSGEVTYQLQNKNQQYVIRVQKETTVNDTYHAPTRAHWLGTDGNGMDMLTRLMYGGRISLMIGFVVIIIEIVLGVIVGGCSGYFGGWVDTILMRVVDVVICIPAMPLYIIIGSIMDYYKVDPRLRIYALCAILGLIGWPGIARMVRGQILSLREQEFMIATEATGVRVSRRIFRHLIPNVIPQLIVIATMGLGDVILMEATLSFLGIGVKFPYASWGNIVNAVNDVYVLTNFWFVWIPAGFLILITVLGFNFVGDGLRDAFDPKMKR